MLYKFLCNIIFIMFAINVQAQQLPALNLHNLKQTGKVDVRYQSYNIEMCEVIGGDFWIPYELIDSVRKNSGKTGFAALKWKIDPVNLYEKKLRTLAAALGPAYVRVSGTWANDIYFQNNNAPAGKAPAGFNNVLTRAQWKSVIDYCKAVDAKLVTSFAISAGMHDADGNYNTAQVKELIDYTKSIGGEIAAAEMFNEPTLSSHGNAPKGYDAQAYAKDFGVFSKFVKSYYPQMLVTGPGSVGEGGVMSTGNAAGIKFDIPTEELMKKLPAKSFDVYTYHYYGAVSKRCGGNQTAEASLSADWLSKTEKALQFYKDSRDTYNPGAPIWLNETAEAACGGDPLASTYADVFRYLEQLGRLAKKGVQSVMHNTLCRSEYALLENDTHNPRPNYWAALLWSKLMGTEVYETAPIAPGVDVFVHSLKSKPGGRTALIINAADGETAFIIPADASKYLLTADELVTKKIKLNGEELKLTAKDGLPAIIGQPVKAGSITIPAHSILFLAFEKYN
jgi:heparanase 1